MALIVLFIAMHCFKFSFCAQQQQHYVDVDQNSANIAKEGKCGIPKPVVVYPDFIGKHAIPRGTILHRCADFIGCCAHYDEICAPTETNEVSIEFTVSTNSKRNPWKIIAEKMVNHTRCECTKIDGSASASTQQSDSYMSASIKASFVVLSSILIIAVISVTVLAVLLYKKSRPPAPVYV